MVKKIGKDRKERASLRGGSGRLGRPRMSGVERRRQIVEVAGRLFARKGFRGTTTKEVAREAGVSEATIFKHFSGKKALFEAIIDRCCNDETGSLILINRLEKKDGLEIFPEVVEFFISLYEDDPSFARLLMFSALEGEKLSEIFFESRCTEVLEYIAGRIRLLIKEGTFKDTDPELAAKAFMGMVIHYCVMQEIYGFKKVFHRPVEKVAETFVGIYLNGMLTAGEAKD